MMDGYEIKALRRKLGLSQKEFAKRLGTEQKVISHWEVGTKRPSRLSQMNLRQFAQSIGESEPTWRTE